MTPFLTGVIPHIHWRYHPEQQELYTQYREIVQHLRHEEFWLDFYNRITNQNAEEQAQYAFFQRLVQGYLSIKDQPRTQSLTQEGNFRIDRKKIREEIARDLSSQNSSSER